MKWNCQDEGKLGNGAHQKWKMKQKLEEGKVEKKPLLCVEWSPVTPVLKAQLLLGLTADVLKIFVSFEPRENSF